MHYLPQDHSYEQITVVLEGGINEEPGKLAIFKKKSEGDVGPFEISNLISEAMDALFATRS